MAETIDQQFIDYIIKALVGDPDKVKIERSIDERGVLLQLYVAPEDLGRVIGRNGTTAKSIRTLLRALGVKNDARYNLKIIDTNGGGRPHRDDGYRDQRPSDYSASDQPAPAAESPTASDEQAVEPPEPEATKETEEPAEAPAEEPVEETEEDKLQHHRDDLKDLTDLDI